MTTETATNDGTTYIDAGNYASYLGRIVGWVKNHNADRFVLLGRDADSGGAIVAYAHLMGGAIVNLGEPAVRPWQTPETQAHLIDTEASMPRLYLDAILRQYELARNQKRLFEQQRADAERAQAKIDEIVDRMHTEADDRGWCEEFDDICDELGLPRRNRPYKVETEVTVTFTVEVEVEAETANAAERAVEVMDERDFFEQARAEATGKVDDYYQSDWSWSPRDAEAA